MNEKVERFVKKYCEKHGISEEEALKHYVVREYIKGVEDEFVCVRKRA